MKNEGEKVRTKGQKRFGKSIRGHKRRISITGDGIEKTRHGQNRKNKMGQGTSQQYGRI